MGHPANPEPEEPPTTAASAPEGLVSGAVSDRAIREAMQRGEFDDLPGRGKPLDLRSLARGPDGAAASILKEANFVPEWAEVAVRCDALGEELGRRLAEAAATFAARQGAVAAAVHRWRAAPPRPPRGWRGWVRRPPREASPARLEAALRSDLAALERRRAAAFAEFIRRADELEARTRRFNRIVPLANRQRPLPAINDLAARFVAAWPALHLRAEGEHCTLAALAIEPPRPAPPPPGAFEPERLPRSAERLAQVRTLTRPRRPPPIG